MRTLINYIRSCFCRHEWELIFNVDVIDDVGTYSCKTYRCTKCGYAKNTRVIKRRTTMAKIIWSSDNKVKVKDILQGDIFKYDNCYYIKTSLGQVTCESDSYGDNKAICNCGLVDLETGEYKTLEGNTYISKIDAAINIFE